MEEDSECGPTQSSDEEDLEPINTSETQRSDDHPDNNPAATEELIDCLTKKALPKQMSKKARKALQEFRSRLERAIQDSSLISAEQPSTLDQEKGKEEEEERGKQREEVLKDITLWGIPLLPSKEHPGLDIILTKFLKAREWKVHEAFEMLRATLKWRKKHNIDRLALVEDDQQQDQTNDSGNNSNNLDKVVYIDGHDRRGHPICFNVYGQFKDEGMYGKTLGTEDKCMGFLHWRIQYMEQSIRKKLEFKAGGTSSFLHITDLKNSPGPGRDLVPISKTALILFQQHYPELIYKNIIINTPFWCYMYRGVLAQYCAPGTRKKFVFARPHNVTQTLLKYIAPENIPVQYGGLKRENDDEFTSQDKVSEIVLQGTITKKIEIPVTEGQVTLVWDVMVVGWNVTYKEEFVPDDEGSYKILIQKEKKISHSIRNSFYIHEPGRLVIAIRNCTFHNKRVFCRYRCKVTLPRYMSVQDKLSVN